jgi:AbrB family looped-hinge helix DNA binding protein
LSTLKKKSQVSIPSELVKKMNPRPGDKLEIEERGGCLRHLFTVKSVL